MPSGRSRLDLIRRCCFRPRRAATSTARSSATASGSPAFRAADIEYRRVYDTRHTFISWALRGGMSLVHLSRIAGTSIAQLDQTYGHVLPDSERYMRDLLNDYDAAATADAGRLRT